MKEQTFIRVVGIYMLALLLWPASASAADTEVTWNGSVRARTQYEHTGVQDARWSERLRLLLGANFILNPELRAEIRMASGSGNRSQNLVLGDNKEPGAPRRTIGLDLAYADWKPLGYLRLDGGRIPQVHVRPGGSQVLLSENIALEGVAAVWTYDLDEAWKFSANTGSVFIRENYSDLYSEDETDNKINWGQASVQWKLADFVFSAGGGFFNFVGVHGHAFTDLVAGAVPGGNTEDPPGVVKYHYLPVQTFVTVSGPLYSWKWNLAVERIVNSEGPSTGKDALWTAAGLTKNAWSFSAAYGKIGADAVPSLFTNSDFANGTTDARGWMGSAQWTFAQNVSAKITQFYNDVGVTTNKTSYKRTHIDLSASF